MKNGAPFDTKRSLVTGDTSAPIKGRVIRTSACRVSMKLKVIGIDDRPLAPLIETYKSNGLAGPSRSQAKWPCLRVMATPGIIGYSCGIR